MVSVPLSENAPPHSTSMVSGSVMSGFTCRRSRSEMAMGRCEPLSSDRWKKSAAEAFGENRSANAATRATFIGLVEDDGARALDLVDRHPALHARGIEFPRLILSPFLSSSAPPLPGDVPPFPRAPR